MTSRIVTAAFVLAAAFALQASAEPRWKGAAWYVVADTIDGEVVQSGPYGSKEVCETYKPAGDEDADYDCTYLSTQPGWDT